MSTSKHKTASTGEQAHRDHNPLDQTRETHRRSVADRLSNYFSEWERAARLMKPDEGFRSAITDAICECSFKPPSSSPRPAQHRRRLLQVAKKARSLAGAHRDLADSLEKLEHSIRVQLLAGYAPPESSAPFDALASDAEQRAQSFLDTGGPTKLVWYRTLIRGLKRAFERAAGRRATITRDYTNGTFKGRFFALAESVLPVALELSRGSDPKYPLSANARGSFIARLLKQEKSNPQNRLT